jgi:hypothetical protein
MCAFTIIFNHIQNPCRVGMFTIIDDKGKQKRQSPCHLHIRQTKIPNLITSNVLYKP